MRLLTTTALVIGGWALIVYDSNKRKQLPPEEQAALIEYQKNSRAIGFRKDAASGMFSRSQAQFQQGEYDTAREEILNGKALVKDSFKYCPSTNTKIGRECYAAFNRLLTNFEAAEHEIMQPRKRESIERPMRP